jgi:hypothetical protein
MPNAAGRRATKDRRNRNKVSLEEVIMENEEPMTTATVNERPQVPDFTGAIESAPDGYSPDRSPAGRTRIPSQFEGILPGLKDKGWQRIRHDGRVKMMDTDTGRVVPDPESVKLSNAHVITRELRKAQHHLKLGMDLHITEEYVEFKIREIQKRKARAGEQADENGEVVEEETDYTDEDDDED